MKPRVEKIPGSSRTVRFGVFEVDLRAGELRKSGLKIRLQEQPFQVLALLLEQPGELVTREEIQQRLWPDDTFVDFDHGLHNAVNKIREALGDSASNPRFVETVPRRGYRFIAPVESSVPRPRWRLVLAASLLALGVFIGGAVFLFLVPSEEPIPPRLVFRRITWDPGLNSWPALSPNGELLAYASDRAGNGDLDIWVAYVGGGSPQRLTDDPSDDFDPSFSPDGKRIVFVSNRQGSGVYVMPAFGGEARRVADKGSQPTFSPDGKWIAYWRVRPEGGELYVLPSSGGPPRRLATELNAWYSVWSPSGKHVLFWGWPPGLDRLDEGDWWLAPADGGPAVKTGAWDVLRRNGLDMRWWCQPGVWLSERNQLFFTGRMGDSDHIFQVTMSPETGEILGKPRRLTAGAGLERFPTAVSNGRLAFARLNRNIDVWSLPIDSNRGEVTGPIERLTQHEARDRAYSISADGNKLLFVTDRSGHNEGWLKDLVSGKQTPLTPELGTETLAAMSRDGSKVAYALDQKLYIVETAGGLATEVCGDCDADRVHSGSSDGSNVLYASGGPTRRYWILDVQTGKKSEVLQHPEHPDRIPQRLALSPDDRWLAFDLPLAGSSPIYVAPLAGGATAQEKDWIQVTGGSATDLKPAWSPDGNLLYFRSLRSGFREVWAQRLHAGSKQPQGEPFLVYEIRNSGLSLNQVNAHHMGLSLSNDRLVLSLRESTGTIWLAEVPQ